MKNLRKFGIEYIFTGDPNGFIVLDSIRNNSVELMQSIGLQDKNGKEYYHKDIFKWDGLIYCVEYNFGGFGYYDSKQRWTWLYTVAREGEIIGNKFENPELLGG